ncbi:helix-turn-helix domain-containing protein [Chryseobacterium balustinum]|uniref:AraC-type DNA-binding protein n=1 Tax=Chryseobacterium balustinum TaxID=246 RepID=A0AAX2IKS7_9FLAO|nr:helix-turn-helix domain-containing protein [Chryseobacterium balustinum]AZB28133.1 helix-turn-helix domain-containing protein [Chryseobacterium balustinum]SKB57088.1 AraC-type DNA-binding protein [Chryseobacterium balustinum]SQA89631.1 DNA-binding transcriptional regulator MelR [Chryseobacterium balustinum]
MKNKTENNFNCKKTLKNNVFLLFLIALFPLYIQGQKGPDFSLLTDKSFQKLYQNPEDCISYSQSILISDKNPEHKIVLRNILSQAYAMQGNYVQSLNIYNQKEEDIGKDSQLYFIDLFSEYSLADQYQNLGLYNQSKNIISNILQNRDLVKSRDVKVKTTIAKLYQLQAINFGIARNYQEAFQSLNISNQYLTGSNKENIILIWENKIFRASYLIRQNKLEEAKKLLDEAINDVKHNGNYPFLTAFAYENLSRYYFQKEDYDTAIKSLDTGLLHIEDLPYNNIKIVFYELLTRNYLALNNDEKYHYYNNLYTDLKAKLYTNKKEGIQYIVKLVETYNKKNFEIQKQNKIRQFRNTTIIVLFFVLGIVTYFFYESRRSKDLKKQLAFFEKQKEREKSMQMQADKLKDDIEKEQKNTEKETPKVSKEKEDEILQKLKEWELSTNFLSKNMSISILSAQTEINTKYLSEVINSNKGKNFNGYINELRINHIAGLLKNDPAFLNYKVSYLAEYSGFSSHGAFTNVFKSITGMSPNHYIQEIIKNKRS